MSTVPASRRRRPRELDDPVWLREHYQRHGDRGIARELGCARVTVTRARERLGIDSAPPGRRGTRPRSVPPAWLRDGDLAIARAIALRDGDLATAIDRCRPDSRGDGAAARIAGRIAHELVPEGPGPTFHIAYASRPAPTFDLIAQRVRAVHDARVAGDRRGLEDALVGLGAAAGLVLANLDRLAVAAPRRLS